MAIEPQQVAVLIPSLEPDDRLLPYVRQLLDNGFTRIMVVDDGSGPSYQAIFHDIAALDGCYVSYHEKNRGKGDALKTGIAQIMHLWPDCPGIITADSDGQQTAKQHQHQHYGNNSFHKNASFL